MQGLCKQHHDFNEAANGEAWHRGLAAMKMGCHWTRLLIGLSDNYYQYTSKVITFEIISIQVISIII